MILITTALQETFPKGANEKVFFLGEWCKVYNKKSIWKGFDSQTIPYHWNDRKKLYADYQDVQVIYEKILLELSNKLNKIHQVNYSLRYWRILIGPWLGYFIQTLFDRWFMLKVAFDNDRKYHCYIVKRASLSTVPNNMDHFTKQLATDDWNEAIYGQLIERCWAKKVKITWVNKVNQTVQTFIKKKSIKEYIREKVFPFLSKIFLKHNNYFFISTYLPLKTELKLQIRLGQVPNLWMTQPSPAERPCAKQRKWKLNIEGGGDFIKALQEMIPMHIPTSYLEGYSALNLAARNLPWPKKPKSIFTSNAFSGDDLFKVWAAKNTENGIPLIIGQHGGNYGMNKFLFSEEHQLKISDKWLSWGWYSKNKKNIIPIGILKSFGNEVSYNPKGYALMVEMIRPRYSYTIDPFPVAGQFLDYFKDQETFLSSLPIELRQQVLLRLNRNDLDWNQVDRWQDSMPEVNIDLGLNDIRQKIKKCRLYIATYNATTHLETLSWNVPTIMFWNPKHWELNEQAKPYFEMLVKEGIFHTTPKSAANKMIEIWDDVDGWWYSDNIQKARKVFIKQYAYLPEDPLSSLQNLFLHNNESEF
jgi:putative transferase (TIGR04331 family)